MPRSVAPGNTRKQSGSGRTSAYRLRITSFVAL
jgi:hypothetical protein